MTPLWCDMLVLALVLAVCWIPGFVLMNLHILHEYSVAQKYTWRFEWTWQKFVWWTFFWPLAGAHSLLSGLFKAVAAYLRWVCGAYYQIYRHNPDVKPYLPRID